MDLGGQHKKKAIQFADVLSRIYLIISLGMSLFIKEVVQIFIADGYLLAWTLVPIILVAYQIRSVYLFYVNTLFYNTKATRYIFIATLSGSLLSVLLTATLTQYLGLLTPAIVLLIQWTVIAIIIYVLSRKIEPVNFKIKNMLLYIAILVLVSAVGLFYDITHPTGPLIWQNLLYKIVLYLVTTFVLIYREIPTIKSLFTDFIGKKLNSGD